MACACDCRCARSGGGPLLVTQRAQRPSREACNLRSCQKLAARLPTKTQSALLTNLRLLWGAAAAIHPETLLSFLSACVLVLWDTYNHLGCLATTCTLSFILSSIACQVPPQPLSSLYAGSPCTLAQRRVPGGSCAAWPSTCTPAAAPWRASCWREPTLTTLGTRCGTTAWSPSWTSL